MNDGLLWYDTTPDNFWTNNQSWVPYNTITIDLASPREFSSVSLAILDDSASGGVLRCPQSIQVKDTNTGLTLAERNPWTDCQPNELNTVLFAVPTNDTLMNTTESSQAYNVTTDSLEIVLLSELMYAYAVSEIQIWVPAVTPSSSTNVSVGWNTTSSDTSGTQYNATSALLGTIIGSFEGRKTGLNCTISDGGVYIAEGGWAEFGGITIPAGADVDSNYRTTRNVTIIGSGTGEVLVATNWFGNNVTVAFDGANGTAVSQSVELGFEAVGRNILTMFWGSGLPWIEAIVVY